MSKKKIMIGFAVLMLVAGMAFGIPKLTAKQETTTEVTTTEYNVQKMDLSETVSSTGSIATQSEITLKSALASESIQLMKDVGDDIKQGDIVAKLDSSQLEIEILSKEKTILDLKNQISKLDKEGNLSYKTSYENALATYESSKNTYESNKTLYDAGSLSKSELDSSKSSMDKSYNDYLNAKSKYNSYDLATEKKLLNSSILIETKNLENLKVKLDKCDVTSTQDGVVTEAFVENGDVIKESQDLIHIVDNKNLIITVNISEYEILSIKEGQDVKVTPYANKQKIYKGVVRKINPIGVSSSDQTYVEVEIEIIDEDADLKPGFSTSVEIITNEKQGALVVPYDALTKTPKGDYIISKVNEDGTTTPVRVSTGIESDLFVEIVTDELKEGDKVMVMSSIDYSNSDSGGFRVPLPGGRAPSQNQNFRSGGTSNKNN